MNYFLFEKRRFVYMNNFFCDISHLKNVIYRSISLLYDFVHEIRFIRKYFKVFRHLV